MMNGLDKYPVDYMYKKYHSYCEDQSYRGGISLRCSNNGILDFKGKPYSGTHCNVCLSVNGKKYCFFAGKTGDWSCEIEITFDNRTLLKCVSGEDIYHLWSGWTNNEEDFILLAELFTCDDIAFIYVDTKISKIPVLLQEPNVRMGKLELPTLFQNLKKIYDFEEERDGKR